MINPSERPRPSLVDLPRPAPAVVHFARALILRCPVCGGGPLFDSWFHMKSRCPTCGFALEREEGYFSGAMAVNLIATEVILTTILVALLIVTWPLAATWPFTTEMQITWYAAIAAAVILPLLTHPFSRTLWIAFDLLFRPPAPDDFRPAR